VNHSSALPEDVRKLLHEHIESYEQLELLLLLRKQRDEEWTVEALTERLHISASLIIPALALLKASGLIATTSTAGRFAYRPTSSDLDAAAARLEREYAERPIGIIQSMSANAIERVRTAALRTFADAFVLRKN
jgi:DNA-binding IclR family transcriptional regulator